LARGAANGRLGLEEVVSASKFPDLIWRYAA
jgi:hypothetical protein